MKKNESIFNSFHWLLLTEQAWWQSFFEKNNFEIFLAKFEGKFINISEKTQVQKFTQISEKYCFYVTWNFTFIGIEIGSDTKLILKIWEINKQHKIMRE